MKGFIYLSKVFVSKVSRIARLEFELAYYNAAVQHVSHYATDTLPYNCMQSNYYHQIEIITWKQMIAYELFVLVRNT